MECWSCKNNYLPSLHIFIHDAINHINYVHIMESWSGKKQRITMIPKYIQQCLFFYQTARTISKCLRLCDLQAQAYSPSRSICAPSLAICYLYHNVLSLSHGNHCSSFYPHPWLIGPTDGGPVAKCGPGSVFCLSLGVSSDYAQPITGQVTEVTCPVIGQAQPELTPGGEKMGPGWHWWRLIKSNQDTSCEGGEFIDRWGLTCGTGLLRQQAVNTLRVRQDGRHFPDDIFKCIFLNENV